jgi:hypothetical protein
VQRIHCCIEVTTSEVGWGVVVDSEGDIGILCLNESGVVNNLEI